MFFFLRKITHLLFSGVESCQEALRTVEKALASVELVKNRSEKDRLRAETLQSALDRLVQVEKDLAAMVDTDGIGTVNEDGVREEFGGFSLFSLTLKSDLEKTIVRRFLQPTPI